MTTTIQTAKLKTNSSKTVLANKDGEALQYANWTAAEKALVKAGISGKVFQSYLSCRFYVEVFS